MMPPAVDRLEGVMWKAAVIVLAGLFVFSPVFHGSWLMDDNLEVSDNAAFQGQHALAKIWQGKAGVDYLPVKTTVMWLLWCVFGKEPTGYHLVSVALHLTGALLLWWLFHGLGMRGAWLGGVLFAVHPIVVESVSWVSELKNTLSMVLQLLVMLAWVSYDEKGRRRDYAWALGLFVTALLCKASVIMWPVVILLYAWWRHGRIGLTDARASLPFFAASGIVAVTTVWLQGDRAIGHEVFPLGGFASRFALAGLNIAFYLWKIVFPAGLLPMYPQWRIDPPSAVEFLPWVALAAAGGWLWTKRRTRWGGVVLFGTGFFLVNAAPVLGFFKMAYMRISWASDHLVYLPCVGIIGLAAAGSGALYDRLAGTRRAVLVAAGWVVLGVLIFTSHRYADAFSSQETLCQYTLRSNPDAWVAHMYAANFASDKGNFDVALDQALQTVRLKPDVAETQNTLATLIAGKGDYASALPHFREAVRLAPSAGSLHVNLAMCLARAGRNVEAAQEYDTLLRADPSNPVWHCNKGVCLYQAGQPDAGIAELRQALALQPDFKSAQDSLAAMLTQRSGEAVSASGNPP